MTEPEPMTGVTVATNLYQLREQAFSDATSYEVGSAVGSEGTLVLTDANSAPVATYAPGQWSRVRMAASPVSDTGAGAE